MVREAGGVGDLVRLFAVIDALAARGPVRWYVPSHHHRLCGLCPSVASGACTLGAAPDRPKRSPSDPPRARWGELAVRAGYPIRDHHKSASVLDLYCPALRHEIETAGRVSMDRLECWARPAGVWPLPPGSVKVSVPQASAAAAAVWFRDRGLDPARTVAVAPTSVSPIRTYRPGSGSGARVGRAGQLLFLLRQRGHQVLVLDSSGRSDDLPATVVCADADVTAQTARLSLCRAFVGVDSGFLHLACALGLPVVALFGPTAGDKVLAPYTNDRRVLQGRWTGRAMSVIGCSRPCYRLESAGYNHRLCGARCEVLESLTEDCVVSEVDQIVRGRARKLAVLR